MKNTRIKAKRVKSSMINKENRAQVIPEKGRDNHNLKAWSESDSSLITPLVTGLLQSFFF